MFLDVLLSLYKGRCGICGKMVNPDSFTVDHIIPASRGGYHGYDNCQPAHAVCNRRKGNLLPGETSRVKDRKAKGYRNNGVARRKKLTRKTPRTA